jgi:hypothetical protein
MVAAVALLVAFVLCGWYFADRFVLDLGSLNAPTPRYVVFTGLWTLFGLFSSVCLAEAFAGAAAYSHRARRLLAWWHARSDRSFVIWSSAAALAIPVALRVFILHNAPVADDESAYLFAARTLASGRLWVASPDMKLFFDQNFMINDGRLYTVYFLGWPAMLAAGVVTGLPGFVNPLLSACTVPPLFRVLRRLVGARWARLGILLFLGTPFIQVSAATMLSHTSCLFALTCALATGLRAAERDASWRAHAAFGFFVALAFWIRPQSAVPIVLPVAVAWLVAVARFPAAERSRALLACGIPTLVLAAGFLAVLKAQNGSPWVFGYARYGRYLAENGFRFTSFQAHDITRLAGFDFSQVVAAAANTMSGMFRLNFDLFGWPSSFVFLPFVRGDVARRCRVILWMLPTYLGLMFFQRDWGIDTFGPMHAFELALPILILSAAGCRCLSERAGSAAANPKLPAHKRWPLLAPSWLVALIVTAWLGFVPVRLRAVEQTTSHLNKALLAPRQAGLHRAVIFSPWPFAPTCEGMPRHFVLFRPVNDPDLADDVLWVNHVNAEADARLMTTRPGRTGYVMRWTAACGVELRPLTSFGAGELPPGPMTW